MLRRTLFAAAAGLAGLMLVPATGLAGIVVKTEASPDPAEVVKAYVAAWNAHSIDDAVSYFAAEVTYYDASVGTPVEGKADATTKVVGSFINAAPDLKWEILGDTITQGEMVAFQWKFSGTNTAAWADGTEPANKPFSFVGASVFWVVDGKIKSQSDYYDALGFYRQLGWME